MTIAECYRRLGGDYAQVEHRLCSPGMIVRFVSRFLEDDSFGELLFAMRDGRRRDAFCAAYTLRSVCANLGFDRLRDSANRLEHLLSGERDVMPGDAQPLLEAVSQDYTQTISAIREYLSSSSPQGAYPPNFSSLPEHNGV